MSIHAESGILPQPQRGEEMKMNRDLLRLCEVLPWGCSGALVKNEWNCSSGEWDADSCPAWVTKCAAVLTTRAVGASR